MEKLKTYIHWHIYQETFNVNTYSKFVFLLKICVFDYSEAFLQFCGICGKILHCNQKDKSLVKKQILNRYLH